MFVLKCKMCGGNLHVEEGQTVCECEYCGTRQTIPNVDDEKKLNLYNRANRLRSSNEFDKAYGVFESIVADFPEEAEAYWGLCLCKYGIEYVDDPLTGKKIPTCHRTSYDSIFDDNNFEMALEYADGAARGIYREEAKEIDRLQKAILEIAKNEEPFDIFICYKETDEYGDRTVDSVIAQDVYTALTDKGYKVFFSRITLEDKLGQEYEPYIFAALNSAKVMLAFGTSYDYYNAVWVKNEWSRYLDLMKKDKDKYLIPCFKGIDAYDMPKEFSHLQAQDMGKVGALQDLLRGIDKIFHKDEKKNITIQNYGGQSLTDKAKMFLEVGAWESANEISEQLLDIDDNDAEAYLIKLLVDLKVNKQEKLQGLEKPFDDNENYQKILKTKNEKIKTFVVDAVQIINDRNYNNSLEVKYQKAQELLKNTKSKTNNENAVTILKEISDYKDSSSLIKKAEANISAANKKSKRIIITICVVIALMLSGFGIYRFVSMNNAYNEAVTALNNGDSFTAYTKFFEAGGFKDSKTRGEEILNQYLKNIKVGDVIKFGHYEQDNDDKNGTEPIEWIVLDNKDGNLLLISEYVLAAMPILDSSKTNQSVVWRDCDLREWMNSTLYDAAFTENEKAYISLTDTSSNSAVKCEDYVFLLSTSEMRTYFRSDEERECKATVYADKKGAYIDILGATPYWTSTAHNSSSSSKNMFYQVSNLGKITAVDPKNTIGVRPAITVKY